MGEEGAIAAGPAAQEDECVTQVEQAKTLTRDTRFLAAQTQ